MTKNSINAGMPKKLCVRPSQSLIEDVYYRASDEKTTHGFKGVVYIRADLVTAAADCAKSADELKLPFDVTIGNVTFREGLPLQLVIDKANTWHKWLLETPNAADCAKDDLLPCPFCKPDDPDEVPEVQKISAPTFDNYRIQCGNNNCQVHTIWFETEEEAVNFWNTRSAPKPFEEKTAMACGETSHDHDAVECAQNQQRQRKPVEADAVNDWEYLLGEISAAKLVLDDGALDNLNSVIRHAAREGVKDVEVSEVEEIIAAGYSQSKTDTASNGAFNLLLQFPNGLKITKERGGL